MDLLHGMLEATAGIRSDAPALTDRTGTLTYSQFARAVEVAASGLINLGLGRGDRVAVWLPKRREKAIVLYGTMRAGGVAVPVNALLKPPQVAHILHDSGARILVTTASRLADLARDWPELVRSIRAIVVDDPGPSRERPGFVAGWQEFTATSENRSFVITEDDLAALFYTSGSTGRQKGVMVSHRNLAIGARSVANYLGNTAEDRLLGVLSLSFDYGFSQLTTAFAVGASVVLLDYRLPQEVLLTLEREHITGLAAVPPIWIQLADLRWPEAVRRTLRYVTNSGGVMPRSTLAKLRQALPQTRVFLMYGLTEAFRSTYLPPEEVERRPDSIGKAIPAAEVLVLRPDGSSCDVGEPGELVHCGPLVTLGYWNDPLRTAERFRPLPTASAKGELAVWSGDTVRRDEDGFLYFIGRQDEMIKTSGHRVSPTEVEDEAYATGLVGDAVAVGVPHARLGQGIVLVASPSKGGARDTNRLLAALRRRLPRYLVPLAVDWRAELPCNANGKFDRVRLRSEVAGLFAAEFSETSTQLQ